MPFCTNCGTSVDEKGAFCHNCGTPQPRPAAHFVDFVEGLSDRTAAILCYIPIFGIIPAIVFLAAQKYRANRHVRFSAFQSLYLFVAWLIVSSAIPVLVLPGIHPWGDHHVLFALAKLGLYICWIYLLVKAAQQEYVRLPIIGDLAARSVDEQL